ncbi:MAG: AraC family transcriptional regulator [bacterium]|nr:AraC family transcriptional regulator [bacterium]
MSDSNTLLHEIVNLQNGEDIRFVLSHDPSSLISLHWHNAIELIYLLKGELEVTISGQKYLLQKGEIILINSKVIHSTKCTKGNDAILVQLPYPFLKRYINDISSYQFTLNYRTKNPIERTKITQLCELLEKMNYIQEARPDGALLQFQSMLFELLYILYHNFRTQVSQAAFQKTNKNLLRLEPILQYTNENYKTPISIAEISDYAILEPKYFCRFFKKNMGMTYLEYLNEVRLSHIYHDLIHTDFAINDILETHGFTNYKLFCRLFKEKFGTTPLQERKKHR